MKRSMLLACLVAVPLAACDRKQPPSAAGTSQDLAPDGTLVNPEARIVREPDPSTAVPVRPAAAAMSAVSAAEQAVRDAGNALYPPESGYGEDLTAIVNAFPAYAPEDAFEGGPIRIVGSDSMGPMLSTVGNRFEGMYP
ncbi:MAG: hypothetical protein ACKOTD_04645, partial [Phycisphaerales bacterium]